MKFPVVDAYLLCPDEGRKGKIAICTNTIAPSMVSNEIPLDARNDLAVMGSLVVNRDGAERLIINSLSHPTAEYLILFGQETLSFCPSTNLLCALMNGYRNDKKGNYIQGGRGVAHHYPSIPKKLLDQFRERFKVLPLFNHHSSDEIVRKYMDWLKPRIPGEIYQAVLKILGKKKIYFDSLTELVTIIQKIKPSGVTAVQLDPRDFQHLQPPIIELEEINQGKAEVNFEVKTEDEEIEVNLDVGNKYYQVKGNDSWLIACSLQKFSEEKNLNLSEKEQLLLGTELSRAEMKIKNKVDAESLVKSNCKNEKREAVPFIQNLGLKADKKYYYKIGHKNEKISVQSLAHDTCTPVFELRAKTIHPIIQKLADENRFEDYEQQFLHRVDVGIEIGRAAIALQAGYNYFQDFRSLFKINKTEFPLLFVESDSFLGAHQKLITALYTTGLTDSHPDDHKGTMRSATLLAAFRNAPKTLKHFPDIYASGSYTSSEMRRSYKEQLRNPDNKGTYTYGSRTRAHFGYDQLDSAVETLKQGKTAIIQRFDFAKDMTLKETAIKDDKGERTRIEATKDPCLTHDIYFISENKLYSFHIARAHNIVNAYPENIFGLYDAYDSYIAQKLNIEMGDMFVLSSRGNILLLTEEQKAKKLIAEPCKPTGEIDRRIGPVDLRYEFPGKGIGYFKIQLEETNERPLQAEALENYQGRNLIKTAAEYLKKRGKKHNNPIIGTYNPETKEHSRLVFFQCNERGKKLQANAVFAEGNRETFFDDIKLCNYIATEYKKIMGVELGKLNMFYAPIR